MGKKNKKYEIDSFEKLVNVANKENIEKLSIDLLLWLNYVVDAFEEIRKKHPKECEGKSNWEISEVNFIWIDDGKNKIDYVKVTNKKTGEVTEIKTKQP